MTHIFIFNNASRAATYGVGTYVKQMTNGLSTISNTRVSLIEMYADTKKFSVEKRSDGCIRYLIPPANIQVESEVYLRTIFYLLARNIQATKDDQLVFQFNYFQHYSLAVLLKASFPSCQIILTVHYMGWCFELRGNLTDMRRIIDDKNTFTNIKEKNILSSFTQEKRFLHLADAVIVLSKSTMDILKGDYKVSQRKMHLVYNGKANDVGGVTNLADSKRQILFVGRLEDMKGVSYLIDAFAQIADKYPNLNLTIVGDGDFQSYLSQTRKLYGRVSFLGRMDSNEVEEIYQQAYIGVIPSFYEQCSYSAIEMMRHGIPLIGTDSGGLSEMLEATPELRIHIDEINFNEIDFVSQIASRLELLLSDDRIHQRMSNKVKKLYKERYTEANMIRSIQRVLSTTSKQQISSDYLPYIDEHMIDLINRHPDIGTDFYGLSGIGAYLWWRVLTLESESKVHKQQLALIKEHLIYYVDWVEEYAQIEPLTPELYQILISMKAYSFFPTKVERILSNKVVTDEVCILPTVQEILQNALRICICRI